MSMEDLKLFLQFHLCYRNFIFDESALDVLGNVYDTNVSHMITDPLLIDKIFSAVIALWEQRDLPELSLHLRQRLDMDVKRYLIALSTLQCLCKLNSIHVANVEDIAKLLVNFNLLVPHRSFDEKCAEKRYIVPAVISSFVSHSVDNIFCEEVNLKPLIYWFDQSPDSHYKELSGFKTSELFCKFVTLCKEFALKNQAWELVHMHSDVAAFRCGPQGQMLAHIACQSCAIVLKLTCIPNSMPENTKDLIQDIRWLIDFGIEMLITTFFPGLQCSVCVSPCEDFRFDCLSRLGDVGSDINRLHFAICTVHGKTLHPDTFSRWFCPDSGQHNFQGDTFRKKQEQKDMNFS